MVLSCCDSGRGADIKGEGMMAMNRGLLFSGADQVIYTLFKIPDAESATLMTYLFDYRPNIGRDMYYWGDKTPTKRDKHYILSNKKAFAVDAVQTSTAKALQLGYNPYITCPISPYNRANFWDYWDLGKYCGRF